MRHIALKEYIAETKTAVFDAKLGNIYDGHIPEAVEFLNNAQSHEQEVETVVVLGLNGIDLTITKGMTVDSAIKKYEEMQKAKYEQYQAEREAWLKTPEGKAYLKAQEDEKRRHEEFVYHSVDEALEDLSKVKPVDLVGGSTSMPDAIEFSRKVLLIIHKCEDLDFGEAEQTQFSEALKSLGCATYKTVNPKYVTDTKRTIGEILTTNDLDFPLSCFSQLIDVKPSTFTFGLSKLCDGDLEYSWIGEWLKAQEMAAQKQPGSDEE